MKVRNGREATDTGGGLQAPQQQQLAEDVVEEPGVGPRRHVTRRGPVGRLGFENYGTQEPGTKNLSRDDTLTN